MHNRDMVWYNIKGVPIKIKCIPSAHLTNILNFINKNERGFNMKFGENKMIDTKHNITQEIRMRKLNRLNIESQDDELF